MLSQNRPAKVLLAVAALLFMLPNAALAGKLRTRFTFQHGPTSSSLIRDEAGNFYGVASAGGAQGEGYVYMMTPPHGAKGYTQHVIHDFCTLPDCADGAKPIAGLIIDTNGNLYGTAMHHAGDNDGGTVFELMPDARRARWTFRLLYTFCSSPSCSDGSNPQNRLTYAGQQSGAPYDGVSPLFGTTQFGGLHTNGLVFELDPAGGATWSRQTLYDFCGALTGCQRRMYGEAGVVADQDGNLFGAVSFGGAFDGGAVYELPATGRNLIVLHDFCTAGDCPDGQYPDGPVTLDAAGDLFGVTGRGGNSALHCSDSCGVVYELSPSGTGWDFAVRHAFCAEGGRCVDGAVPYGALTIDASGNVYGVAGGGKGKVKDLGYDPGIAFSLMSDYGVLYRFCHLMDCTDGTQPQGGMALDGTGRLFGITLSNGAGGDGTMFELTP